MPKIDRWYRLALELATTSEHQRHKMAAVVVKGGRVLSKATNSRSNQCGKFFGGKHAELRALMPHHGDYSSATIIIARENGLMSKPCPRCQAAIRAAGIANMIYADQVGLLVKEKVA